MFKWLEKYKFPPSLSFNELERKECEPEFIIWGEGEKNGEKPKLDIIWTPGSNSLQSLYLSFF